MLEKATIVLKLQRKYDSYINYMNMGNKEYALNALLNGYKLYVETAGEAANQNMTEDFELVKRLITDALADTYGVSEQKAAELIAIEDAGAYKAALAEIFEGDDWAADTDVSVQPETEEPLEDVLTEEQEMIDQMAE